MKTLSKFLMALFIAGHLSCKDTTKEDAETEAALQEIESVENSINEASENMDEDLMELEEALKELDSI